MKGDIKFELFENIEVEKRVLGFLLLCPQDLPEVVASGVTTDVFFNHQNRLVFQEMQRAFEETGAFSVLSLDDRTNGKLDKSYLLDLMSGYSAFSYSDLSTIKLEIKNVLLENARRRKLINACSRAINATCDRSNAVADTLVAAQKELSDIMQKREASDFVDAFKAMVDIVRSPKEEIAPPGLMTGFQSIDNCIGGLKPGEVYVIAARPGAGKTSLAMNMVTNIVVNHKDIKPVLVFSLEMPTDQIIKRQMSSMARMTVKALEERQFDLTNSRALVKGVNAFKGDKAPRLLVSDRGDLNVYQLESMAHAQASQYGGVSLVLIDYVQLIDRGGIKDPVVALEEISHRLTLIAKSLGVPVLLLSQMSRSIDKRQDTTPQSSDLRGSGALEQDASVIMILRPEKEHPENVKCHIVKNRHGSQGVFDLSFLGAYTLFTDVPGGGDPEEFGHYLLEADRYAR